MLHKAPNVRTKFREKLREWERFRERLRKFIAFFQDLFLCISESVFKLGKSSTKTRG